jgi:diguanylate cyclase (GGDEF)-like protein
MEPAEHLDLHNPVTAADGAASVMSRFIGSRDRCDGRCDDGLHVYVDLIEALLFDGDDADFDAACADGAHALASVIPGPDVLARTEQLLEERSWSAPLTRRVQLAAVLAAGRRSAGDGTGARVARRLMAAWCSGLERWPATAAWVAGAGSVDDDPDMAYWLLTEQLEIDQLPPVLHAEATAALGETLVLLGDPIGARPLLESALLSGQLVGERRIARTAELLAALNFHRGEVAEALRRLDDARAHEWAFVTEEMTVREPAVEQPGEMVVDLRDDGGHLRDPLTHLLARPAVRFRLAQLLDESIPCAVLTIGLDHLGRVNETLGHRAGDELICALADRLHSIARPNDVIGRWGGDEFVMALPYVDSVGIAQAAADRIMNHLGTVWVSPSGERWNPSISIGITLADAAAGAERGVDLVLGQADSARLQAKREGGAAAAWFGADMAEAARRRYDLEQLVRDALSENRFEMWFQPVHPRLATDLAGAEALIRLRTAAGEILPPTEFLGVAESSGLAGRLGRWVINESVRHAAGWARDGIDLSVSVNIGASQLRDDLAETVCEAMREHDLDPRRLVLELTEHTMLEADKAQVAELESLRALGVRVALDDFGTSYSSLSHLRDFPVDIVKIDRSFVEQLPQDRQDAAIVRAVVELSRTFQFRVVAEGVETMEQLIELFRLDCTDVQGFLLGAAVPPEQFAATFGRSAVTASLLQRGRTGALVGQSPPGEPG